MRSLRSSERRGWHDMMDTMDVAGMWLALDSVFHLKTLAALVDEVLKGGLNR